jgi:hypothetical protein
LGFGLTGHSPQHIAQSSYGFGDLTRFDAFRAYAYLGTLSLYQGTHCLQVGKETTTALAGYALPDTAFFLGKATPFDRSAGDRPFSAYKTKFRHCLLRMSFSQAPIIT